MSNAGLVLDLDRAQRGEELLDQIVLFVVQSGAAEAGEAEGAALLRPKERQAGMGEQLLRGEITRMAALEDRPGDVGGEVRFVMCGVWGGFSGFAVGGSAVVAAPQSRWSARPSLRLSRRRQW